MADLTDRPRTGSLTAVGAPSVELVGAAACAATLGAAALGALSAGADVADGPVTCPFRAVTGLPCPFCGMTHSLLALGRGSWGESVAYHPLGPAVLLVALLGLWRFGRAAATGARAAVPRAAMTAALLALCVAWVAQLAEALA